MYIAGARGKARHRQAIPFNILEGEDMTDPDTQIVRRMYDCFNARDVDGVLAVVTDDVVWANGMDGGHVRGREALREYWTRQWGIVRPQVEPVAFDRAADGAVIVEVIQTVRDLDGKPLQGQTHGLKDKTVGHVFRLEGGRVARFDIRDKA
jgi:ketosteroid isomerase-like protein